MAVTVTGTLTVAVQLTAETTSNTLGKVDDIVNVGSGPTIIATGTGTNQFAKMASGSIALAASTPQDLDLTAVPSGTGTQNFATWKLIYLSTTSGSATKIVTVGPGASNGATIPTIPVAGGSPQLITRLMTGVTVDGTHKTITLDPGSDAQTIQYVIAGT